MPKQYKINEIYKSIQGEGNLAGTEMVFVRFTGCNMRCQMEAGPQSPGGFDCDTEFESGVSMTSAQIAARILEEGEDTEWVVFTGGEPGLQLDGELLKAVALLRKSSQIETNGSILLPKGIDFITVSPKVAEHCIRQRQAHEVKYVRGYGQAIPKTVVTATYYFISPAFNGVNTDERTLEWCKKLCRDNPPWQLSVQRHKLLQLR